MSLLVGIALALSTVALLANVILFVALQELEGRVRKLEAER